MKIQTITHANEAGSELLVTSATGESLTVPWPSKTWHGRIVQEWLDAGNTIGGYVPREPTAQELLARSDREDMPRIAEDILDTLIAKGVLALSDLPLAAQDKINARIGLRASLG